MTTVVVCNAKSDKLYDIYIIVRGIRMGTLVVLIFKIV